MLTQSELMTLVDIAKTAGEAIMAVYENNVEVWQKDDRSPLTEADLASDKIIRENLEAKFPGVFILSEESSSGEHSDSIETLFLVDPLDGTKEFIKRNGEFTVNIALIKNGEPIAGVVYAPALQKLYYAANGLGAWKQEENRNPEPIKISARNNNAPLRVVGSRSHAGEEMERWLQQHPNHVMVPSGSSLKLCYVAEGAADIYPRLGPTMQWDTAAGQAVVEVAGGHVVDAEKNRLLYGFGRPLKNGHFFVTSDLGLI